MKKIKLTQGKYALVDNEYFKYLNKWKWCYTHRHGQSGYAVRKINIGGKGKKLYMQHLILERKPFLQIDHINGNKLDNRKLNLRYSTPTENKQNVPVRNDSSTGFRGITKSGNKFILRIQENKNRHFLGSFKFLKDAVRAYNENVLIFHGEFARFQSI